MQIDFILVFAYISAVILFLSTPGPVTVMVVNTAAKYGFKSGLATVAGTNTASLVLMALSFAVIQGAFSVSEKALAVLTFFGSLYLLVFAIGIIKDKIDLKQVKDDDRIKITKNHFKDGFIVGIANPKDVLFFIGFFPLFFNLSNNNYISMAVLSGLWIVLDYAILSGYSLVFSKITNNRVVNIISKLSGLILLLVAVYAIYHTLIDILDF